MSCFPDHVCKLISAVAQHNVRMTVFAERVTLFAHGFGCDQTMWRHVAPHFEASFKVAAFGYVGAGASETNEYDSDKYSMLDGYVADVVEIADELRIRDGIIVGHSVSATHRRTGGRAKNLKLSAR